MLHLLSDVQYNAPTPHKKKKTIQNEPVYVDTLLSYDLRSAFVHARVHVASAMPGSFVTFVLIAMALWHKYGNSQ